MLGRHGRMPRASEEQLQKAIAACTRAGAELVYLLESRAKGEVWPERNADFAVLLGSGVPRERYALVRSHIIGELMSVFEPNNVHVVILNEAPTLLAYEGVIQEGRLLFERDPLTRIRFEDRAFQEYVAQRRCETSKPGT